MRETYVRTYPRSAIAVALWLEILNFVLERWQRGNYLGLMLMLIFLLIRLCYFFAGGENVKPTIKNSSFRPRNKPCFSQSPFIEPPPFVRVLDLFNQSVSTQMHFVLLGGAQGAF